MSKLFWSTAFIAALVCVASPVYSQDIDAGKVGLDKAEAAIDAAIIDIQNADAAINVSTVDIQNSDAATNAVRTELDTPPPPPPDDTCARINVTPGPDNLSVHPTDPNMLSEHSALLALAPQTQATHIAVANCRWSNPETWEGRAIPGADAKVWIPSGLQVDYDSASNASLFTVRVDGVLSFSKVNNTNMRADTIIIAPGGKLSIGSAAAPMPANISAQIIFADNGPIDLQWDPQILSRGLISHGDVEIHGQEKLIFSKVATPAMAGDMSITLEDPPAGWRVGDMLVLTGTKLIPHAPVPSNTYVTLTSQDEEITVANINGNVIGLARAILFDHDTPRADLKAYVANLTRNILFTTENANGLPVFQRGHTMFMHSDSVDVRYAEFRQLGRTNKRQQAFDVQNPQSSNVIAFDANIKARYPFHFHKVGVDLTQAPAIAIGNSVWKSPGWAYVHHESNANFFDNVGYDAFGAVFVAEVGNETGRWVGNIAIKSFGVGGGAKLLAPAPQFDLARTGAGYWFQGRLVASRDNIAASIPGGHGYVYMHRGHTSHMRRVRRENLFYPETMKYREDDFANVPPITQHTNNLAFGVQTGSEVIKAAAQQKSDLRTFIEDFTAWEVQYGLHMQYTGHYTFKNIDVIATKQGITSGGILEGIAFASNAVDMTVLNARVEGFQQGVRATRSIVNLNAPFDGDHDYSFVNIQFINNAKEFVGVNSLDIVIPGPLPAAGPLTFQSAITGIPIGPNSHQSPNSAKTHLAGIKTDALGPNQVSLIWDEVRMDFTSLGRALELEGFWTLPDGRTITVYDQYVTDRVTQEVLKHVQYIEAPNTDFRPSQIYVRYAPPANGLLDLNSAAPIAGDDVVVVVLNTAQIIDVLANDVDPDGDAIQIDGIVQPQHGLALAAPGGGITYTPDHKFSGNDVFYYWVEDTNAKTVRGRVDLTVQ